MLTLAYNSRPHQSTGVAPLEFITPERVRSLSVERMLGIPAPEEKDGSPRGVREAISARLRDLIHKVRWSFSRAERRLKRSKDARMKPVNKDMQAKSLMFVEGHARTKHKLRTHAAGPHKVLSRRKGTFSLDIGGYPETVKSDHVTAAADPLGDPKKLIQNLGVPRGVVVPKGPQHTGKEFSWEALVGHEVSDHGTLRLRTRWRGCYPDEDTLDLASRFDVRGAHHFMRRVGLHGRETGAVVNFRA